MKRINEDDQGDWDNYSQKNDCDFQDDWGDWGDFGDQEDWGWVDGKSRMTKMTGIHQDD